MKPFLVTTRFLRPNLTSRVAHVPLVVLKGISFPARCNSTLENADPLPQSKSPDTADSSQHTSVANANASGQKRARRRPWTPDEQRKLKAAAEKGMTVKAIATLFPTRSYPAVSTQWNAFLNDKNLYGKTLERRKWSPEEMNLLAKLHADGLKPIKMRAHFPDRSTDSISRAIARGLNFEAHQNSHSRWSREDDRRLTELVQSTDKSAIAEALGRSIASIELRAALIGVKLPARIKGYTPEEIAMIFQMRHDNASFKQIAEKLGRSSRAANSAYNRYRPFRDSDAKVPENVHTRLSIEELERVNALRAQGVSWPEIGNRYPTHSFKSIAEDYRRFIGFTLSPDQVREIVRLRSAGKSWNDIVELDQFYHFTKFSLQHRYYHALRKLKSQQ